MPKGVVGMEQLSSCHRGSQGFTKNLSFGERPARVPFPKPSIAIMATLLGGGLAGSVFTYWVNRPKTTFVSYSLNSATIADTESGSLVPGLKVQIGNQDIRNLYTHSIVLTVTNGPQIDSGDVAIDFPPNTKFFGEPGIATPSPVHKLECGKIPSGLICKMAPVRREDKLPPFRVSVATDEKADPDLVTSTKGLELQPAQETLTAASKQATYLQIALAVLTAFLISVSAFITRNAVRNAAREAALAKVAAREAGIAEVEAQKDARFRALERLAQRVEAASDEGERRP
jgi:hypothetical protein